MGGGKGAISSGSQSSPNLQTLLTTHETHAPLLPSLPPVGNIEDTVGGGGGVPGGEWWGQGGEKRGSLQSVGSPARVSASSVELKLQTCHCKHLAIPCSFIPMYGQVGIHLLTRCMYTPALLRW